MHSPPPTPPHASPREQAVRLLTDASVIGDVAPDASAEPASDGVADMRMERLERLFERISSGLSRWLGPYGVHALMTRALSGARPAHPALAGVTIPPASSLLDRPVAFLTGWDAASREHGATATIGGATAVIEALVDQMRRLIGEGLATTLLEQSATMVDASENVVYAGGARGVLLTPTASMAAIDPSRQAAPRPDVPQPDRER